MLKVFRKKPLPSLDQPMDTIPITVQKEELRKVSFRDAKPTTNVGKRSFLKQALKSAMIRPDRNAEPVSIFVNSLSHGILEVRSKVLAVGPSYVTLPGSIHVPNQSILRVAL